MFLVVILYPVCSGYLKYPIFALWDIIPLWVSSSKHTSYLTVDSEPQENLMCIILFILPRKQVLPGNLYPVSSTLKSQWGYDINFATMEKWTVFWFFWSQEFGTNESQNWKYDAECFQQEWIVWSGQLWQPEDWHSRISYPSNLTWTFMSIILRIQNKIKCH